MATSRGELKGKILRLLMKTAAYPGFYQLDTIDDAIQEAMDFVSAEFFMAGEGWSTRIIYLDTQAGQLSVDLPVSAAMIKEVRYLFSNVYSPMIYDDGSEQPQYSDDSGVRQWSYQYRIVDNALYFNPPMAQGGEKYLQVEYYDYAKRLQSDTDFMESQFDQSMQHFIKYRAASILAATAEKFANPWADLEASWYTKMRDIIVKRNLQSVTIREFTGD